MLDADIRSRPEFKRPTYIKLTVDFPDEAQITTLLEMAYGKCSRTLECLVSCLGYYTLLAPAPACLDAP